MRNCPRAAIRDLCSATLILAEKAGVKGDTIIKSEEIDEYGGGAAKLAWLRWQSQRTWVLFFESISGPRHALRLAATLGNCRGPTKCHDA